MSGPRQLPDWQPILSTEGVEFTQPEIMVKLLATIGADRYPHITLITSNHAEGASVIKWGQFTQGRSKKNVLANPEQGIFYMTAEKPFRFLQVKAALERTSTAGEDAADFNKMSLFRYNTYMRIGKVYYNRVEAARPVRDLGIAGIVKGMAANLWGLGGTRTGNVEKRLPEFGNKLFNTAIYPKFVAYLDPKDGYPVIFPVFQARAVESKHILFPLTQFRAEIVALPADAKVAFYALNFELMSIQAKGTYLGLNKSRGVTYGRVDIDQVYNGMPPVPGQVYPALAVRKKVEQFSVSR